MPDSRHFVTTWLDGRQTFGLRMVDTETRTTRTIYGAPASLLSPSVSPDGTRLAFVTGVGRWKLVEIMLGDGRVRQLGSGAQVEWYPSIGPDGTRLVFAQSSATASTFARWH